MITFLKHLQFSIYLLLLIVIVTLIPSSEVASSSGKSIDKAVHFILFFGFTLCTLIGLVKQAVFVCLNKHAITITFSLAIFLAFATELLQKLMDTGRAFEWNDILADLLGAVAAYLLFLIIKGKENFSIE